MKGHGISAMRSRRYRRFFEEHGCVLSLLSVRPRSIYTNGLHRMWTRREKEDFWQRELEQIGQQEVLKSEVFVNGSSADDETWGYQDRYAEYKHHPSTVHAEFRDLLNYWHLARSFASPPGLNASFVECDPSKRIFAEQTQDSMWLMVNHSIQARRMVTKGAGSRIL
jgi:Capsid protein (F protein)